MMEERKLHDWLRKKLEPCDYQRIEGAAQGFPDINVARCGVERWIELKVVTNHRVLLRKEQFAWSMRRSSHSSGCYVIALEPQTQWISVWVFPHIKVQPYSKYLQIDNNPFQSGNRLSIDIKSILFPSQT